MNNKKLKRRAKIFKKFARKVIKAYGLSNWRVVFRLNDDEKYEAYVYFPGDYGEGSCVIFVDRSWLVDDETSNKDIKRTAFHEVTEILIHNLVELGKRRFIDVNDFWLHGHDIIRSLENSYFKELMKG